MLDTNAVSALVKGRAPVLVERLERQPFCLSVITEAELRFGLARRPVHADLRRLVEHLLRSADIRPWTSTCAARYANLRATLEASGRPVAAMDLMIASHALAEGCILVTADAALLQVPGLEVLNWNGSVRTSQQGRATYQVQKPAAPAGRKRPTSARRVATTKAVKASPGHSLK